LIYRLQFILSLIKLSAAIVLGIFCFLVALDISPIRQVESDSETVYNCDFGNWILEVNRDIGFTISSCIIVFECLVIYSIVYQSKRNIWYLLLNFLNFSSLMIVGILLALQHDNISEQCNYADQNCYPCPSYLSNKDCEYAAEKNLNVCFYDTTIYSRVCKNGVSKLLTIEILCFSLTLLSIVSSIASAIRVIEDPYKELPSKDNIK